MKTQSVKKDKKLILTREFDAPPSLLFEVWSSCKHLKHWWGPVEWPMQECEMDFRVGGKWRYCLRGPNTGDESWGLAIYKEINEPEMIVYRDHFTDSSGNLVEDMPDMIITVEFQPANGKTRQINTILFESNKERDRIVDMGAAIGWDSSLNRLDELLLKLQN